MDGIATPQLVPLVAASARAREKYQTLWNLIASGQLAGVRRGRLWYVEEAELERFIRERDAQRPAA